jgi:hypothetical protein
MMVDGRFLKITGRIKELYKLENGKYITPVPLEDSICRSQFVLQCMVYGSNRPFNVALIVPDFVQVLPLFPDRCPVPCPHPFSPLSQVAEWAKKTPGVSGLDLSSPEAQQQFFENETVIKLFNSEVLFPLSLPPVLLIHLLSFLSLSDRGGLQHNERLREDPSLAPYHRALLSGEPPYDSQDVSAPQPHRQGTLIFSLSLIDPPLPCSDRNTRRRSRRCTGRAARPPR